VSRILKLDYIIEDLEGNLDTRTKEKVDIERTIDMLEKEKKDQNLAFRIWRYADGKHVENHFRDLGYETPEELLQSLNEIDGKIIERENQHELRGLKHSMEEIYTELKSDYCF
jgi:hypothetical protein